MADEENEYISVVQAVKFIPKSFDGNPKFLREFCEVVEATIPDKTPAIVKIYWV
jgi:hypothetical protein